MKFTDVMHPGDWFIYQSKHANWILAQATKVEENGVISANIANSTDGYEDAVLCSTLKEVLKAAEQRGLKRTWKIGYHRWKVEKAAV